MKKVFVSFCAFVLSFSLFIPFAKAAQFNDVTKNNRFYKEILFLSDQGIISGFPDGNFKPGQEVTRAAAAIIIGKALNLNGEKRQTQFKDVTPANIAAGYIASAVEEGIISGFPDGTFRPNEFVTRGQMAILLSKAFELTDEDTIQFSDVHPKMAAYPYIKKMTAAGIASGYEDNTYKPDLVLKREQFAAFMARALNPFFIPGQEAPDFSVSFLNVGQGDATLVEFPDGKTMLIDAGPSEAAIKQELAALNIKKINVFVATHPGDDHIGGADYVINEMNVEKIFDSGLPGTDEEYQQYVQAAERKKIDPKITQTGQQLSPNSQVDVEVLHANRHAKNIDDGSSVIQITHGEISYLLTSEAGKAVEDQLMANASLQADILKTAKHGAEGATSQPFIKAVDPLIAIFSTDGRTGYPDENVKKRLEDHGADLFSTAEGTIVTMGSQNSFYIFQEDGSNVRNNEFASFSASSLKRYTLSDK
ncbi:S-layer homology domain-containing protein [Bacillus sp. PK3_68]|uniref:S-layer homology domain-containing protein n=1 Tax=Bacillus sp. PK3_68 TaxID=2027408 RepID=UPI001601669A|nr:S-layer homology domain-containing protein [Bacillus sp. PK3_68]